MIDVSHLWNVIHGNEQLKSRLISDIMASRLSHAYVIEGPKHSGKLMLARTIASAMCDSIQDVKKISVGASPDVIEIDLPEKKKSIGVDKVREMKLAAYIKPNDLDFKCFIIRHADTLTVQAQNALLKLIEEPPRNVYIFLLCENVATLLPTIRSRAPILRMQVFSAEKLSQILLGFSADAQKLHAKDKDAYDAIVRSSGGSYGEALLRIVDTEMKMGDLNYAVMDIMNALCERDGPTMIRKVYALPPDREGYFEAIHLMRLCVRDVIAYRSTRGDCDYLFPKSEKIPYYATKLSLDRLLKLNDVIVAIEKSALANPSVQASKSRLFSGLCGI